jgi:hypothetical protein
MFEYIDVVGISSGVLRKDFKGLAETQVTFVNGKIPGERTSMLNFINVLGKEGWKVRGIDREDRYWFVLLERQNP